MTPEKHEKRLCRAGWTHGRTTLFIGQPWEESEQRNDV